MKKVVHTSEFTVFPSEKALTPDMASLMSKAKKARESAYAPYSNFTVGAAILLKSGVVVIGSNQENAAFPSGLCAERTAIFSAGANYPNDTILAIAISAGSLDKTTKTPIPPCGACRQVISEYENKQESPIEIFFMGESGKVVKSDSIANLLPFAFSRSDL